MNHDAAIESKATDSILILGQGKSGTTAMYDRVNRALAGSPHYRLFEPTSNHPFDALGALAPGRPILTKVVMNKERPCRLQYERFDKRIMIIRDPRDIIVSRLMFRPLIRTAAQSGEEINAFVAALKEKQADPSSWSIKALSEHADELGLSSSAWKPFKRLLDRQIELSGRYPFFISRYEDFIVGEVDELASYLDLELERSNEATSGWLAHLGRSMGSGEWKEWFHPDDVQFFRPMLSGYLEHFGYDHDDWKLSAEQTPDPANGSGYIETKLEARRSQIEVSYDGKDTDLLTPQELAGLQAMVDDGRPAAGVQMATLLGTPGSARYDPAAARRVAYQTALQGNVPAMEMLAASEPSPTSEYWREQALFWTDPVGPASGSNGSAPAKFKNRTAKQWYNQAQRNRRALNDVRSSVRVQAIDIVADAIRNPGRNTLSAPARLWALRSPKDSPGLGRRFET